MLASAREEVSLPPAYRLQPDEGALPFAAACAQAAAGRAGAGAFFVDERPGLLAFAVILEPETPLVVARRVFPLAMGAVVEAILAHCPPERAVRIVWPDTLVYDTGRIGGGRLAWPAGATETAVPDWLVFGCELLRDRDHLAEPGRFPASTSLREEGFERPLAIVESFARHLMLALDVWEAEGYERAAEPFLSRLEADPAGAAHRIGPNGDLLVRAPSGRVTARQLLPALAAPQWYDPARGGPRL